VQAPRLAIGSSATSGRHLSLVFGSFSLVVTGSMHANTSSARGGELLLAVVYARVAVAATHADAMADEAEASGQRPVPDVGLDGRQAGARSAETTRAKVPVTRPPAAGPVFASAKPFGGRETYESRMRTRYCQPFVGRDPTAGPAAHRRGRRAMDGCQRNPGRAPAIACPDRARTALIAGQTQGDSAVIASKEIVKTRPRRCNAPLWVAQILQAAISR